MVTRSTDNYDEWKEGVRQHYLNRFPKYEKNIDRFMEYISELYDSNQRTYIPYKLMWFLYDKKRLVKKNQHYWFACIGRMGGEGKSTLSKHILHFEDATFNSDDRTAQNNDDFIKIVHKTKNILKLPNPSILLDEMDPSIHMFSKEGTKIRKIITKMRQFNLFVGVCANSLTDIPPFIYQRLTTIIYINDKHRFWLWDERKDKPKYDIINDIKTGWKEHKHGVFKNRGILNRAYLKNMGFSPLLPFKEKTYDATKNKDLVSDIEKYLGIKKKEEKNVKETNESLIKRMVKNNPKLTDEQIAKSLNLSRQWVNTLKNKVIKCQQEDI